MNRRQFLRALASTTALVAGGLAFAEMPRDFETAKMRYRATERYYSNITIDDLESWSQQDREAVLAWYDRVLGDRAREGSAVIVQSRYIAPTDWKNWIAMRSA